MTIGATAQPVSRREPVSEESQNPSGLCRGVRYFNARGGLSNCAPCMGPREG